MFNRTLRGETKKIILYALSAYIFFSGVYLSIASVIQVNSNKVSKSELTKNEERLADVEKTIISNRVNRLITDVLYISDTLQLSGESLEDSLALEKQWLAFSNRKKIYDQIRFIDLDGNEMIRINYAQDGAYSTKKEDLQNKKDRYYFTDTINLKKEQVYISKLDLNIENDIIEQPIKPMIRLSTPCYGADGKLKGIVILNYSANDMLNQVSEIASTSQGSIFLLNANGYWLYNGKDSNKAWAFMYEDRVSESFQNEFPNEWKTIKSNLKGSLITQKGVFSYTNILTSDEFAEGSSNNSMILDEGDWYIVSYIEPDSRNGKLFSENMLETILYVLHNNVIAFIFLFFVALFIAILIAMNKLESEKIKYFSEYDAMTGAYNRRAGFEKLSQIYKAASKEDIRISICFIDINGLKEVNDALGHEKGDELIMSVIRGIKKNIRDTDFVARLGGDEFLIIFHGMDEIEAENVWERINQDYEKVNETENRKYIISASHGIEEFKFNSNEYIEAIINHADEKMYNEKRIIKKELKVIRE